ncbi:hypothetical protein ACFQT0_00610 [Hymenobacter humi]|uniref:Uncharacterized protein n=1 Tax=Hymenobacter humi TaxID=1411620 RepID=A0ABW2U0V2_9BACT
MFTTTRLNGGVGQHFGHAAVAPDAGVVVAHALLGALDHGLQGKPGMGGKKRRLEKLARHAVGQQGGANGGSGHAPK